MNIRILDIRKNTIQRISVRNVINYGSFFRIIYNNNRKRDFSYKDYDCFVWSE